MTSRLTQEEENFVKMSLLLTGISPRAVRALFDREFAPACLYSSLQKGYNKLKVLKKKRIINQTQWNLLYPISPDVLDSKTFDVTLMITLLRNLANLTSPHGGYELLPSSNELTPTSDLARIKFYRNIHAHLGEGKIDNDTFITAWDDITGAIDRLGGEAMRQECDNLKTKVLDKKNQELMADIQRSNEEMRKLKESVQNLEIVNADLTVKMEKLKDTVPWNVREQINENLEEWKDNDTIFIKTRAAKHVLTSIKRNSCVTIIASSGVGKTAILRHVALQMAAEGYDLLPVKDPGDIVRYYNPNMKTLFAIDDLCGNYSFNQTDMKVWEPFIDQIEKILSNKLVKILVACRLQVYQDDKFEYLSIFKTCTCNLLSDSMCLLKAEKKSIADLYLKTKSIDISDCYDLYDCFPLLCKLFQENPTVNITQFFHNPFSVYEAEIDKLEKKGFSRKYCALALCVMFNNTLKEETLTEEVNKETRAIIENTCEACRVHRGTSGLKIQDELNSFIHTFLKKEQNIYKTIHDKIFDFLVYYFGQKIIRCLIRNADSGLIKERFLLEKQDNADQFITIVPTKYHQIYIERMIDDYSKGLVIEVFNNINMKISKFRQRFLCHLKGLDISYQKQLVKTCDVRTNETPLAQICYFGDLPMMSWCFHHDVDVNQCNIYNDWSPLMIGCNEGHTKTVRMLLDKEADYDKCDKKGWTPIMFACRYGKTKIVRMLVDIGADYTATDNQGWTPLMFACNHGHAELVKLLLDTGADYKTGDNKGWTPLMFACNNGHAELVKLLLDTGADYKTSDNKGWTPLMFACNNGHAELVKLLLDIGADYETSDMKGWTPLMFACNNGHAELVKLLLDTGADYKTSDNKDWTPLMFACNNGHAELVKLLLDTGADYKTSDNKGWTPLMFACNNGHAELVKLLLETGADYNKSDIKGWTPIIFACRHGYADILRMLVDIGADYSRCEHHGRSPLIFACINGHNELVRMLLDLGADFNKCDYDDCSPVMFAFINGHSEIVKMLSDIGAV